MEIKNKFDQMSQDMMLNYKLAQFSGKIHGVVPSAEELDSIQAARFKNKEVAKANDCITSLKYDFQIKMKDERNFNKFKVMKEDASTLLKEMKNIQCCITCKSLKR